MIAPMRNPPAMPPSTASGSGSPAVQSVHTMTVANMAGKQLKAPGSLTDFLLWHKDEAEELPPPSEFFRGQ